MRLCRFRSKDSVQLGLYDEKFIVPLTAGAAAYTEATHQKLALPKSDDLLDFLPPEGKGSWRPGPSGKARQFLPRRRSRRTASSC